MTLQTTNNTSQSIQTLAGNQTFFYDYRIDLSSDAVVAVDGVTESGFSITGLGDDAGGTVTLVTAPAIGAIVVVARIIPETQTVSYPVRGAFPAPSHERAMDRAVMMVQQIEESRVRSLRFPLGDLADPVLGDVVARSGKFMAFDAEGNITHPSGTGTDQTLRTDLADSTDPTKGDALVSGKKGSSGTNLFSLHTYHEGRELNTRVDFGILGDGTDETVKLQAAVDSAIAEKAGLVIADPTGPNNEIAITAPISISAALSIRAANPRNTTILCKNTDGFDFAPGVIRTTIEGIGFAQEVRHTTAPNTYFAVRYQGTTGSRPFWNTLQNIFIDGFGVAIDAQWLWNQVITNVHTAFCGKVLNVTGISANNYIFSNSLTGEGTIFDIGDGANTVEGFHIFDNLLNGNGAGVAIDGWGTSYFNFNNNVCDFMGAGSAVLFRSTPSVPAIGNNISGNYIAFSGAGNEGIRLLNNLTPGGLNTGSKVTNNTVFAYTGGSLVRGIYTDGTSESNNVIIGNSVAATLNDINNDGAVNSIVSDNQMLGQGFSTTALCTYQNNNGPMITSEILTKKTNGKNTEYWSVNMPVTGTYVSEDIVNKTSQSVDVNGNILKGWHRLVSGSSHILGTDWAEMYIKTASP